MSKLTSSRPRPDLVHLPLTSSRPRPDLVHLCLGPSPDLVPTCQLTSSLGPYVVGPWTGSAVPVQSDETGRRP